MYEVAGESVVPGIDCQNVESIFEEHSLTSRLGSSPALHNVYAISERKFDFGAVLAAVAGAPPQASVKANFKFTNIFKVSCTCPVTMLTLSCPCCQWLFYPMCFIFLILYTCCTFAACV